ncbi:MAG TPA: phospholipid carrier-dependent glycosyltransferase [Vicinamibacteria bacterium]|nr:phospholipid carrier-dependent glycosyltransferase [Vicinamibacteria bacterium]
MLDRLLECLPTEPRRTLVLLGAIALAAALFRLPGLSYPGSEYFDEVYHAKTALQYLRGEPPTEWVHPPTAKLLIAVGVALFGYEPWAWRLAPALAGTLLAPVFFLLAHRVLATERAALLATLLLLLDGVYLVQSRVAMTNVFAVLFQLLAALLLVRAATADRPRLGEMAALGLALGLALSTRWTSVFAWGFLGLVYLGLRRERAFRPRELALGFLAFALLPAVVYLVSYVPWMEQAHPRGLVGWWTRVRDVVVIQRGIWRYHADLSATHSYFSPWWTWPLLVRPTWYFWWSGEGWVRGIVALGNPAIWWASIPAAAWAAATGVRWRDPRRLFAGAGFFFLYVPWGLSPRTLNFSHYLFEAIPYACLALGTVLDRAWDGRHPLLPRAYVALAMALFLLFLPFLTAIPVPTTLWGFRFTRWGPGLWTWFETWV